MDWRNHIYVVRVRATPGRVVASTIDELNRRICTKESRFDCFVWCLRLKFDKRSVIEISGELLIVFENRATLQIYHNPLSLRQSKCKSNSAALLTRTPDKLILLDNRPANTDYFPISLFNNGKILGFVGFRDVLLHPRNSHHCIPLYQ